jgi:hypothetical protein
MDSPKSYSYYAWVNPDDLSLLHIRNVFRMGMVDYEGTQVPVREEAWNPLTATWGETDDWLIREFHLGGFDFEPISEQFAIQHIEGKPSRELYLQDALNNFGEGSHRTWEIRTPDRSARADDFPYVQVIKKKGKFLVEFSSSEFLDKKLSDEQVAAILSAGWKSPNEKKSPNFWKEYKKVDSTQKIASEVLRVLREAFIAAEPIIMNVRWFALVSNKGKRLAYFRTKYDGVYMRESRVWNSVDKGWQADRETMHKWLVFGDTNIDEIERGEAEAYLPKEAFAQ